MATGDRDIIKKIPKDIWNQFASEVFDDKHFRYETIRKFHQRWNLLYSARNDGKSTAACADETLKRLFVDGYKFLYLRRYKTEAKASKVEAYFREKCFLTLIGKILRYILKEDADDFAEFHVYCYAGEIRVRGYSETYQKDVNLGVIGYYISLQEYVDTKSGQFPSVGTVLYEEFLATNKPELPDEFETLLNAISTYTRDNDFVCICVGNTVKRRSSIFDGFGVNPDKIPLGIVQTYKYIKDGQENTLAVLHIAETSSRKEASNNFFFGERKKTNLIGDEWYISDYPTIPDKYTYNSFKPRMSILISLSQIKLYVYFVDNIILCSTERLCDDDYIVYTDRTDLERKWLSIDANPRIKQVIEMFKLNGWVYYNNNYAGDDLTIFLLGQYGK